jgi:hypothetical protein
VRIVVIEEGEEGAILLLPVGQPVQKLPIDRFGILSTRFREPIEQGFQP